MELCSKCMGLNKNLLIEAQVMVGLKVGLRSTGSNGAPRKIHFAG